VYRNGRDLDGPRKILKSLLCYSVSRPRFEPSSSRIQDKRYRFCHHTSVSPPYTCLIFTKLSMDIMQLDASLTCVFSYIKSVIMTLITVAGRCKTRNVFSSWNTGIVLLDHIRGIDVCLRFSCLCCPVYVAAFDGLILRQRWKVKQSCSCA
jgi:hypothetical protein